jgi:hypothetical protein
VLFIIVLGTLLVAASSTASVLQSKDIFMCSTELVALLGGVVALEMPRTLLFEQVFEAPEVFFELSFAGR